MNRILSKISGPLLIGSILALGALAFPVHADAADGRFIFRAQSGLLPMQVVANDGTGGTGGSAETSPGGGEEGTGDGSEDGGEDGSGGTGEGDGTGGEEVPAWKWDGHFDMLTFSFPNGWTFLCQTGDWHTAADREARFAMARTLNGQPAVGWIDANTKTFSYKSDAIEFTVSRTGAPTVTPGHALGGILPPCYEPDPATNGALYRESPNPVPKTITQTMAGTPVITSRRIH